jgi:DNA mismatch endonuclease (patch repair protein)
MADKLTAEHRSWNMSRIRGKNTNPEKEVRSILHRMGYRFRLHRKDLPGRPDIVMPKFRTVIFVHGCFWHLHTGCNQGRIPATRREFWENKLSGNAKRDKQHQRVLRQLGWHVITVWECDVERSGEKVAHRLSRLLNLSS